MKQKTGAGASVTGGSLVIRNGLGGSYPDIYTPEVLAALEALSPFDSERKKLMADRIRRRKMRADEGKRIEFLDAGSLIPGTQITVADARAGRFNGPEIPADLRRQWIQGTGPGAKPGAPIKSSIRNVAYALLSGADGWMFDGEDAMGQISTMSLDNQRNLKLAFAGDALFMDVAGEVAAEMNKWAGQFFGRSIISDWREQLRFTTKIFRARGLHLDDRHVRFTTGESFSASVADMVMYVVNNHAELRKTGSSVVLYLPKIQTAGEAALWNAMITALEGHLGFPEGTIKVYVLVEQIEATFQLMEIRAALGRHFVGYNTGRWDYINSVADAMTWDPAFINPNIESVVMTYGYMRTYEDRVRRAVNTPDREGRFALWQGGMEPNIPVGSPKGVADGMKRALASGSRRRAPVASGWHTGKWCTSSGPSGRRPARTTSWGGHSRPSPIPGRTPRG